MLHKNQDIEALKSTIREYQLKIVHIENTHTKVFQ